jgi:lysozyme family protein
MYTEQQTRQNKQHRYTQVNTDILKKKHRYTQVENITIQVSKQCVK